MRKTNIVLVSTVVSVLFAGGTAFAQSTGTGNASVSVQPQTSSVSPALGSSTAVGTSTSGAMLSVTVDFVKQVPAGLKGAILAMITLDATRSTAPVTLTSVPISVTTSGSGSSDGLSNCVLISTNGASLTTGVNSVPTITGTNTFSLDAPISIPASEGKLLALRCDVSANAAVGSVFNISFAAPLFQANSGGIPITVTQGPATSGSVGTNSGSVTVTPQGSAPSTIGTPYTPGVPNTGAGGDVAITLSILAASLAVLLLAMRSYFKTR